MCNNRCNGSCNRCESTCDPCRKQPKIYYCGGDISCAGVTRGEEISRAIKKLGDKLCQTVNQQNPLTYVNITDATEEQCAGGGLVLQILQVGTDNLVSEHILCNEGEDFQFSEDISCGGDVVVSEGENIQNGVGHVVSYFCDRLNSIPAPTGFIPLSGTEVGNPVTGDIELASDGDNLGFIVGSVSSGNYGKSGVTTDQYPFQRFQTEYFFNTQLLVEDFCFLNSDNPDFKGYMGGAYFGANYTNNTYVQKKYVDNAMIPLDYGTIENAGGIENVQVYTTGSGTGIASVDLSPTMAIGKDVTVSDLANNCSTHNIQINSGVGNTILYNGVASQDITLNTSGTSVTIRKMTANQFMVIAKN